MTLLEVVNQYVKDGHKVSYRVRTDGGIIITSVDGMKFTRAGTGNKYLRQVTGVNVSAARMEQTTYNVGKFIKLKKGQKKASSKGDILDLKKLTKKVQAEWRKNKTVGEGKVNIRQVRWYQKHKGYEYTKDYLERRLNYSRGFAYEENVYYWADKVDKLGFKEEARVLRRNYDKVPQKLLNDIHDINYTKSLSRQEKNRQIKRLLDNFIRTLN